MNKTWRNSGIWTRKGCHIEHCQYLDTALLEILQNFITITYLSHMYNVKETHSYDYYDKK